MLMSALKKQTVFQQTQFTEHDLQSIFKIKGAKIKIKYKTEEQPEFCYILRH